jgi:hypothetical protein
MGERWNVFSFLHPEGEPFPPFDTANRWWSLLRPAFFGAFALFFLAMFFGLV